MADPRTTIPTPAQTSTTTTPTPTPTTPTPNMIRRPKKCKNDDSSSFHQAFLQQMQSLSSEVDDDCSAFGEEIARGARNLTDLYERECFFQEVRQLLLRRRFANRIAATRHMPALNQPALNQPAITQPTNYKQKIKTKKLYRKNRRTREEL